MYPSSPRLALLLTLIATLPLGGCAHTLERQGDAYMAENDPERAVASWESAMQAPLMDYELSRIQEKRRRALFGIYGVRIDELRTRLQGAPLVLALVALRAEAHGSAAVVLARFDAVILEEIERGALRLTEGTDPAKHLGTLMGLRRDMANLACPEESLAAVERGALDALSAIVADAARPVEPRLAALFDARVALRAARFDARHHARFDEAIERLAREPLAPLSGEGEARRRLERWLAIDEGLFREHVGAGARRIAAEILAGAAALLLDVARAEFADGQFHRALELTELLLRGVPGEHEARGWYDELRAGTARVSLDRAQALGDDRAALELLHRGLARHMGADEPGHAEAARAAAPLHVFEPVLQWTSRGAGCDPLLGVLPVPFQNGERIEARAEVRCVEGTDQRRELRSTTYKSERMVQREQVFEERVQVTKYRTEKRQCSRASSLEGYRWEGVCEYREPYQAWETRHVTRLVDVVEPFEGSMTYDALLVTHRSGMQGRIVLTTEDGQEVIVPVDEVVEDTEVAYAYVLPPEKLAGPERPQRREIPASFTLTATRASAAQRLARTLYAKLEAAARAHRAEAALARGRDAEAADDLDLAGHEYARAALWVARVDPSTDDFWQRAYGIDAALATEALFGDGARPPALADAERRGETAPELAPLPAVPSPVIWADSFTIESKGFDRIFRGHESGHFRARAFTHVLPNLPPMAGGEGAGDRYAPMIGISYHFGALQYLVNGKSGWGFRLHDEVELGGAGGVSVTRKAEDEGRAAYMLNARYLLGAGLRTHYFSVFAGMRAGANYLRTGAVRSASFHVDPFVRLSIRTAGPSQIVLYLSGFQPIDGLDRVDTAVLRVPVFGRNQFDLVFTAERFRSRTRAPQGGADGSSNMGDRDSYLLGAGIGIVW